MERQAREPASAVRVGVGEHPAADEEEGLDRAAAEDDEAGGAGAWAAGRWDWSCWSRLITWGGIEGYGTLRASALVESLKTVEHAGGSCDRQATLELPPLGRSSVGSVRTKYRDQSGTSPRQPGPLPVDASQVDYLFDRLLAPLRANFPSCGMP